MIACPRCGAKADQPCTYVAPRNTHFSEDTLRQWPSMREKFARVGQPMQVWHRERHAASWPLHPQGNQKETRSRRMRRLTKARAAGRSVTAVAIHEAEAAWDREERRQLVRWLSRYADVLTGSAE